MWFHAESSPPSWHPVNLKEIDDGLWSYQGRNEYHINCHIQDISENGADVAHLDAVHSVPIFFGGQPSASWSTWFKGLKYATLTAFPIGMLMSCVFLVGKGDGISILQECCSEIRRKNS